MLEIRLGLTAFAENKLERTVARGWSGMASAGTRGDGGHRPGAGKGAACPGPKAWRGQDHLQAQYPAAIPAPREIGRGVAALALCLKGVSTGVFTEALEALLGPNARGLSAKTITRLKADWWTDYETWRKRDLGMRRFLCIRADGVYFKLRMAGEKQCVMVIVGADE